jgi:hypothetical protein
MIATTSILAKFAMQNPSSPSPWAEEGKTAEGAAVIIKLTDMTRIKFKLSCTGQTGQSNNELRSDMNRFRFAGSFPTIGSTLRRPTIQPNAILSADHRVKVRRKIPTYIPLQNRIYPAANYVKQSSTPPLESKLMDVKAVEACVRSVIASSIQNLKSVAGCV